MNPLKRVASITSLALSIGTVAFGQHYTQVNLVSNVSGVAPVTDPQLVNPWGLARSSSSPWWVADTGTGLSTLYNGAGTKQSLVVTVPKSDPNSKIFPTGTPTGVIFNSIATDFVLSPGNQSTFIFSTLDGTIAGWNANTAIAPGAAAPSTNAITVVKTKDGSVYTGLTSGFVDGNRYLYAANFGKGRVDVYDSSFHPVKLGKEAGRGIFGSEEEPAFVDPLLPNHFVPFNVQAVGNDIVVTFALLQEGSHSETDGPGLGFVDIFSSKGKLLQRLEHGEWLNAPWGVALAPLDFGAFSHALLVAQFAGAGNTEGSGTIAAYDLVTGRYLGLVQDATGKPIAINGIWAISPANSATPNSADPAGLPASELYFTAGSNGETGGLFGYLKPLPTELSEGNAQ